MTYLPPNHVQDYWRRFLSKGVTDGVKSFRIPYTELTPGAAAELAHRFDLCVVVVGRNFVFNARVS